MQGWAELLQALVQCFDSNDFNHMEGALDALSKVTPGLILASLSVIIFLFPGNYPGANLQPILLIYRDGNQGKP